MAEQTLHTNDVLGSREIGFTNRQESTYPNLMRFCLDFRFRVLQLLIQPPTTEDAPETALVMVSQNGDGHPDETITPRLKDLDALERHVAEHQVEILHDYLFGLEEQA